MKRLSFNVPWPTTPSCIADRLEQVTTRTAFTNDDKTFIESQYSFFLATATAEGQPTCNLKGGKPGFVRVVAPDELVFPDYDGDGMFLSIGNISANPNIGLLFIDFEKPKRLRVNGTARASREDPLIEHTVGAQLIVRVGVRASFPNCPRYIPKMQLIEPSVYIGRGRTVAWGNRPVIGRSRSVPTCPGALKCWPISSGG
jgi:predicted pyridoxine 5'-phosphate oxidase superfamily flavin-nucleotide-binding protein